MGIDKAGQKIKVNLSDQAAMVEDISVLDRASNDFDLLIKENYLFCTIVLHLTPSLLTLLALFKSLFLLACPL